MCGREFRLDVRAFTRVARASANQVDIAHVDTVISERYLGLLFISSLSCTPFPLLVCAYISVLIHKTRPGYVYAIKRDC